MVFEPYRINFYLLFHQNFSKLYHILLTILRLGLRLTFYIIINPVSYFQISIAILHLFDNIHHIFTDIIVQSKFVVSQISNLTICKLFQ